MGGISKGEARWHGWPQGGCAFGALVLAVGACGDDDDEASAPAVDAAMLEGRTFVSTDVEGQTLVDGTVISLSFEAGAVTARAGCNTLRGGFEINAGILVVSSLAQTQIACDDAVQEQDVWISELLESGPAIEVADDVLRLASDTVTVTLSGEAGDGA